MKASLRPGRVDAVEREILFLESACLHGHRPWDIKETIEKLKNEKDKLIEKDKQGH